MFNLETYTVSFFGHRDIYCNIRLIEDTVEEIARQLINTKPYVEFLMGRDGEFDILTTSVIKRTQKAVGHDNNALVWVLPYPTADFQNNADNYEEYYDEIEICEESAAAHFKSAFQIRNRSIIDRSDLCVFYVERKSGGAYQTMQYAIKQGKKVINLAEQVDK